MAARSRKLVVAPAPVRPQRGRVLSSWLFPAYLVVIFAGCLALHNPKAMPAGNQMGLSQALFTSINAATLTGFPQSYDVGHFQPPGQITVFLLIVAGSLFSLVIGGLAAVRILRLPYSDRRVIAGAAMAEVGAMVLGTVVLLFDAQRTTPEAIFLSASAFGNCGLDIGHLPSWTHWQTPAILLPLMMLGGLGLPVLMELYDYFTHRRPISFHSRAALNLTAWFFIGGTLLLSGLRWASKDSWRLVLGTSAALNVNARTGGMDWFRLYHVQFSVFCALLALMSIGGASAGTAGGIKTTTLLEIVRQVARGFMGQRVNRSLWIALSWLIAFGLVVNLTVYFLVVRAKVDLSPQESVLKAFSAVSNCGMVAQEIPKKSFAQFYILSAAMLAGRFCSLSVIWWMADSTKDADIAVG